MEKFDSFFFFFFLRKIFFMTSTSASTAIYWETSSVKPVLQWSFRLSSLSQRLTGYYTMSGFVDQRRLSQIWT